MEGLRNDKGEVHLCLTRKTQEFLDCAEHDGRVTRQLPASAARSVKLERLSPGSWSLLVLHDENGNGKLDKTLGIPREGFGFSGNPKLRMGPPKPREVRFDLPAGSSEQHVRLRYLL
nr:DUF2141 domain-containing protein [Sphingomicrobium lutaoense]